MSTRRRAALFPVPMIVLLVALATLGLIVWPLAHDRSLNAAPVAAAPEARRPSFNSTCSGAGSTRRHSNTDVPYKSARGLLVPRGARTSSCVGTVMARYGDAVALDPRVGEVWMEAFGHATRQFARHA